MKEKRKKPTKEEREEGLDTGEKKKGDKKRR